MSGKYFSHYGEKTIMADVDVNGNSLELTISDNTVTAIGGKTVGGGGGSELPTITEDDNGKVLTVLDGNLAWTPGGEGEIPSAAAATEGDVLTADGQGSYGWSAPTGGGSGSVNINIGDFVMGIPADTELWDKIAEPLFNDQTLHIVATYAGVAKVEITAVNAAFEQLKQYSGANTFTEFKTFIESSSQFIRYAEFTLGAKFEGAEFNATVPYSTGLQPKYLIGFSDPTRVRLYQDDYNEKYIDLNIMLGTYTLNTEHNIWEFNTLDWDQTDSGSDIIDPCNLLCTLDKKNFTGVYVGDMGNLSEATAGNTIYSTNDSEESEWLSCQLKISQQTTISDSHTTVTNTISVRINGLATECDASGFPVPDKPQVPIMWCGKFNWINKNGIYAYRCVSEQLVVLATV